LATIRDVASAAGVSIATVSRVFNRSTRVDERTADRVWRAAAKLDYWPNNAARSLTTNRTQTLGVLLPDLYGEFFSEVIRGIDRAAQQQQFQVLISSSHAHADEVVAAARSMRGRTDGLIIMASDTGCSEAVGQVSRGVPVVLINPSCKFIECSSVGVANFDGAFSAVQHLLRLGHREIAIIKGPAGNIDAEERLRGFREAVAVAGWEPEAFLEVPGDFTERAGYLAAEVILQKSPRPTAVFAANDYMAIGLLSALHDVEIEVPQQLAVVGFDDIAMAKYLSPSLTTVHVDLHKLGERAVQLLLAAHRSGEKENCVREVLATSLVVRQSCGAAGSREPILLKQGGVNYFS
jgi:LacI family transcriptional regulator